MSVRTGEKVDAPCRIYCVSCGKTVDIKKPGVIRKCGNCGSDVYDIITGKLELPGTDYERKE